MNEEYDELLLHCEVRWLPKGKVCQIFGHKNIIYLFLSETDELQTEQEYILNDEWLNDLALLGDTMSHLKYGVYSQSTSTKKNIKRFIVSGKTGKSSEVV
ncbi:hypothetical protein RF11_09851 [Thelohanellus kitauei]|uniref:Uncharacterized protein n=1 Tax=Thelohanellus kitauei TaxID=669202 RepID=A0A0C2IXA9_THEKT|nr:hypothetical protein RF11_09851 [Thelohanellus kitauei]